jgi:hypothetical protein
MDIYKQLRQKFDGADSFVAGGHAVGGKPGTLHAGRVANTPEWAYDDEQVRQLLLKVFPNWKTNPVQRARAARWAIIIQLYFRIGWTSTRVAMRLGVTIKHVQNVIYRIGRARKGVRTRDGVRKGLKPRGRPRINREGIPAPSEDQGDYGN